MSRDRLSLKNTAEFVLPEDLTEIRADAFRHGSFSSVYCGENISSIDAYAFAENDSLQWIWIPPSVTSINKTAFYGCPSTLSIHGEDGSYAETFADENGFVFCEY